MASAAAGSAFAKIALGATAVGAGVSAFGSIQQGRAAQAAARYNAQVQEANAAMALQESHRQAQLLGYQASFQERDARAAEANAQNLESQAAAERLTASENVRRKREENRRILSRMRSRIAKSGVAAAGTPIEMLADAGGSLELEALQIGNQAEGRIRLIHNAAAASRATGAKIGAEAALSRYSASATRTSGAYRSAMLNTDAAFTRSAGASAGRAAALNAGSSVLGGISRFGQLSANMRYYGAVK